MLVRVTAMLSADLEVMDFFEVHFSGTQRHLHNAGETTTFKVDVMLVRVTGVKRWMGEVTSDGYGSGAHN